MPDLSCREFIEFLDEYENYVELKLSKDGDSQAVLKEAISHVTVSRFEVVVPTLHGIFLDQVGGNRDEAAGEESDA